MLRNDIAYGRIWGEEILALRLKKELPQKKIADAAGITVRTLYELEHGKVSGKMFVYECIVRALGESFTKVRAKVIERLQKEMGVAGKLMVL